MTDPSRSPVLHNGRAGILHERQAKWDQGVAELKKSVDLAAFIKEIEQGDPHVVGVELTRTKSKKPKAG